MPSFERSKVKKLNELAAMLLHMRNMRKDVLKKLAHTIIYA